jgi:hypothetical protein
VNCQSGSGLDECNAYHIITPHCAMLVQAVKVKEVRLLITVDHFRIHVDLHLYIT